ncbi:chaplin [Streptomyces cavernae]|uniref:chaplin n=1 Tax=Streptomyces cavernae TaxID=2259034 RepID=UPI000FEB75DC|nr:chaplin family protein [Streptomyces cavernae]
MRQVTRKSLMTVAAATGVLAVSGGYAHADAGAQGSTSDSPGVLSGNTVQAPIDAPVNICGNTVNVVGVLNPAMGNACVNGGVRHPGTAGGGGAQADGQASASPGVASGNHLQVPVHAPVNVCGNSVDVAGAGNATTGNECANTGQAQGQGPNGGGGPHSGGGAYGGGGAQADGQASSSPGVASGNHIQVPVHAPVNVCGNSVTIGGAANATTGDECGNGTGGDYQAGPENPGHIGNPGHPAQPGNPGEPTAPGGANPVGPPAGNQPEPHSVTAPRTTAQLAQTGSDLPLGMVLPVGAGALFAGAVLYRKARATA